MGLGLGGESGRECGECCVIVGDESLLVRERGFFAGMCVCVSV